MRRIAVQSLFRKTLRRIPFRFFSQKIVDEPQDKESGFDKSAERASRSTLENSKSSFKFLEVDQNFHILKNRQLSILELGAAPGSWTKVIADRIEPGSKIVTVDIDPMSPIPHKNVNLTIRHVVGDCTLQETMVEIFNALEEKKANVIISDLSEDTSDLFSKSNIDSNIMNAHLMRITETFLKKGGALVFRELKETADKATFEYLQLVFKSVTSFKPSSIVKSSNEIFYVCRGFGEGRLAVVLEKNPDITLEELNHLMGEDLEISLQQFESFKKELFQLQRLGVIPEMKSHSKLFSLSPEEQEKVTVDREAIEEESEKLFDKMVAQNPLNYPKNFHEAVDLYIKEKELVRGYLRKQMDQIGSNQKVEYLDLDTDREFQATPSNPTGSKIMNLTDPELEAKDEEAWKEFKRISKRNLSPEKYVQEENDLYVRHAKQLREILKDEYEKMEEESKKKGFNLMEQELRAAGKDTGKKNSIYKKYKEHKETLKNLEALQRLELTFEEEPEPEDDENTRFRTTTMSGDKAVESMPDKPLGRQKKFKYQKFKEKNR